MLGIALSSYLLAQYIAPRDISRNAVGQRAAFSLKVGNPTDKVGKFYVDPISVSPAGTPSFKIEPDVHLSSRIVTLTPKNLRQVNAMALMEKSDRSFFICTSPVAPTIVQSADVIGQTVGVRVRACSLVQIKQLKKSDQ